MGGHCYSYLFGPSYRFRAPVGAVFVHALFGEISQGSGQLSNLNYTKFAWVLGTGLDLAVSHRISVRALQLDYERAKIPSFGNPSDATEPANGFRYSGGVVFKF